MKEPRTFEANAAELVDYHALRIKEGLTGEDLRSMAELWEIMTVALDSFVGIVNHDANKREKGKNIFLSDGMEFISRKMEPLSESVQALRTEDDVERQHRDIVEEQKIILDHLKKLFMGNHARNLFFVHDRNRYLQGRVIDAARHVHTGTDEDEMAMQHSTLLYGIRQKMAAVQKAYEYAWLRVSGFWSLNDHEALNKAMKEDLRETKYRTDRLSRSEHAVSKERQDVLKELTLLNIRARQDIRKYDTADLLKLPEVDREFLFKLG